MISFFLDSCRLEKAGKRGDNGDDPAGRDDLEVKPQCEPSSFFELTIQRPGIFTKGKTCDDAGAGAAEPFGDETPDLHRPRRPWEQAGQDQIKGAFPAKAGDHSGDLRGVSACYVIDMYITVAAKCQPSCDRHLDMIRSWEGKHSTWEQTSETACD